MDTSKTGTPQQLYKKDYSKLEEMFDAAVEKTSRKKIIYYASNKLFLKKSRQEVIEESFKNVAEATPLSLDDIQTEIKNIAEHKSLPLSEKILNNENSLISFIELANEVSENTLMPEETEPVQRLAEEDFQDQFEEDTESDITQDHTDDLIALYYSRKNQTRPIESQEPAPVEEEPDDLLIDHPIFQESLKELEDTSVSEEPGLPESRTDVDTLYSLLYKKSHEREKDNLLDLIASIQNEPQSPEPAPGVTKDLSVSDSSEMRKSFDTVDVGLTSGYPLKEKTEVSVEPVKKSSSENTLKRRIKLDAEKASAFFEDSLENTRENTLNEKINGAYKKLYSSRLTFIATLIVAGFYVLLIFPFFQTFDLIALILTCAAMLLSWEFKSRALSITDAVLLAGLLIFAGVNYYLTGTALSFIHWTWFILIPLCSSSSYVYIRDKKYYSRLLLQNEDSRKNKPKKPKSQENQSVFIEFDDQK